MTQLKENFAVETKHEPFFTGGKIYISNNGTYMFCGCGNKIHILEVESGQTKFTLSQEEDEEITHFCLSPNNEYIVVATKHLVLRQWNWKDQVLVRSWKAIHISAVLAMDFDMSSTLLATGSSDTTIKLWDIDKQYCTHNLKGHTGVISMVKFHPDNEKLQLFSAADDYKVKVWDLRTSKCLVTVEAHFSVVTSMVFSPDGTTMYSGGRDRIISVWNLEELKVIKAIPVFESVEAVILLPPDREFPDLEVTDSGVPHIITAGSKGTLRVWNIEKSKCVHVRKELIGRAVNNDQDDQNITQALYSDALQSVAVVTFDNNITLCSLEDLSVKKQFCGNTDQVLDVQFLGAKDTHLAVATNSEHLKVFEISSWNCQLCSGHTDIILGVTVNKKKNLLATCSKDNTVRVWRFDPESGHVTCIGVGHGHTHIVSTVAMASVSAGWIVSGGQDFTLKKWKLPQSLEGSCTDLRCTHTERVHEKDINCVVVSPNDRYIATGSHDRTAKLWDAESFALVGVMRGHKRGIWCVQFSPVDQCIATSSGDGTIKIWSIQGLECVKTFEGHDSAVLRVTFINRGMQLLSCGSDGLMKIWVIKTSTCVSTMDEHEDKIWSITVNKEEDHVVTGGADSSIILWKDVTGEEVQKKQTEREEFILKEQELSNLLHQKKYLKAIGLAITLEQPFRVLSIIKEILYNPNGKTELETTLQKLRLDQIDSVLRFASEWNTNSRHCHEAQFVLHTVLRTYPPEEILKFSNIKSTMEALIPYTERHFQRMNRLLQQAMFLEFTWGCMRRATEKARPMEDLEHITSEGQDCMLITESAKIPEEERGDKSSSESDLESDKSDSANSEEDSEGESMEKKIKEQESSDSNSCESDIENTTPSALMNEPQETDKTSEKREESQVTDTSLQKREKSQVTGTSLQKRVESNTASSSDSDSENESSESSVDVPPVTSIQTTEGDSNLAQETFQVNTRLRRSQQILVNSAKQNTTIKEVQQTMRVKSSRKRSQQVERDEEEQMETRQKYVKKPERGQRTSQTVKPELVTNSAKKLKQPLTRSKLLKQKGR
ncbi:transducin beta-like protein 3 [Saccostrea echinata]|uniref:transducin beta-like protein 3 n=1 Tax=Saccostrea echinata TaxID=191078 RepID=UPI002A7F033A|nr:transducin beta-like protein 3 [Saccostrea echinata]XP_061191489.1 transducin beta-like protein 3 [Saccostrea echinata]